jgi:hypothetical protein
MFLIIHRDGDDQFVEQSARSVNDIEMPVGYRVETSWIDSEAHKGFAVRGSPFTVYGKAQPNVNP